MVILFFNIIIFMHSGKYVNNEIDLNDTRPFPKLWVFSLVFSLPFYSFVRCCC